MYPLILNCQDTEELLKRDHTIRGGVLVGIEGHIVEVQARATKVLKRPEDIAAVTSITGMGRGAVTEVLGRIHGAFNKLEIPKSPVSILINLAPANLPKEGTWLDLAIAIVMLQASGYLPDLSEDIEQSFILMGEIGIHGDIRRVPGTLSIAFAAGSRQRIIVPEGNEKECALVKLRPGCEECYSYPVNNLSQVIDYFNGKVQLNSALSGGIQFEAAIQKPVDFSAINGQEDAKEAALISAAGGHNLLMIGPPGEGKSLLASAIPGILPRLTEPEIAELTCIYSACGKLERDSMAVTRRPMRTINNTASVQAILGGGSGIPMPGEITLSHLGVLFMDEFPEFSRSALEGLRHPIESGVVRISRAAASLEFPARFTLIAAMNPCPCGFYGYGECRCKESEVQKYQNRISGPIMDRIDLKVELAKLSLEERFSNEKRKTSSEMRKIVQKARNRQIARFDGTHIPFNAAIPGGSVRDYCSFTDSSFQYYKELVAKHSMSTRTMDRLAKVARTVADIDDSDSLEKPHLDKAAKYVLGGLLKAGM